MYIQALILITGLALLYIGSTLLVEGAASTAVLFAVRPVIIGLTIVSLATSAPELLVSLVAAIKGSQGISIGNILGSNAINISLVLGISAIIKPVHIAKQIIKTDIPYMIGVSLIFWILCLDSNISHLDGVVLISLLIVFLIYSIRTAKEKKDPLLVSDPLNVKTILKNILFICAGIIMLAYGANFVVQEAMEIAGKIGLSQTFIGISVVALGTSLPELATSAVAASKGQSDISVGNVVGSNLFNICLVMGIVGLFNPMRIDPDLHVFQFPFMAFICLTLGGIAYSRQKISKITGLMFILLFTAYIFISYLK
ncbi:MAG: calcium/sodium antiporter [Proteobacteria bacterium]|nr:calcium/sodium antiporter [Pseudomonadota bacterium]MBU1389208.1 calcium/sodium antiporter [Pseudomonadota bacterium]MBU1543432.1 calcium/sodium antiporter [Pseudomonadota bacterium]MBU2430296.1 calcium/sodium antiporter [Pseudomonadota bacterium]